MGELTRVRPAFPRGLGDQNPDAPDDPHHLILKLNAESAAVRAVAASRLGILAADSPRAVRQAIPVLIEHLHDDLDVRVAVARTLGTAGRAANEAVPALRKLLLDEDPVARRTALWALERLVEPGPALVPTFGDALEDQNLYVRKAAAEALARLGSAAAPAATALARAIAVPVVAGSAAMALNNMGRDAAVVAAPTLADLLRDSSFEVRRVAEKTLVWLGPAAVTSVPTLRRHVTDPEASPVSRVSAAAALGAVASDEASIAALTAIAEDPGQRLGVRKAAEKAVKQIRSRL
jgi:HEAT repeat protein